MNSTPHLILASNSPRRQQLLRDCGFEFEVFVRDFDETFPEEMPAHEVAEFLAVEKNKHYRPLKPDAIIITADTTVVLENEVLNKPGDEAHAYEMLSKLSGKTHQVISGVCISSPDHLSSFSDITSVTFRPMSDEDIWYYIKNFKPFDKAGSYGIQEWIGMTQIESINGSYFNVMGLPTLNTSSILKTYLENK